MTTNRNTAKAIIKHMTVDPNVPSWKELTPKKFVFVHDGENLGRVTIHRLGRISAESVSARESHFLDVQTAKEWVERGLIATIHNRNKRTISLLTPLLAEKGTK